MIHVHCHPASGKHGVTPEQIRYVVAHALRPETIRRDYARVTGPDMNGQWIELVYTLDDLSMDDITMRGARLSDRAILVIHAQPLMQFTSKRRKRRRRRS